MWRFSYNRFLAKLDSSCYSPCYKSAILFLCARDYIQRTRGSRGAHLNLEANRVVDFSSDQDQLVKHLCEWLLCLTSALLQHPQTLFDKDRCFRTTNISTLPVMRRLYDYSDDDKTKFIPHLLPVCTQVWAELMVFPLEREGPSSPKYLVISCWAPGSCCVSFHHSYIV